MLKLIAFAIRWSGLIVSAIALVEGLVDKNTSGPDKKALVVRTAKDFLTRFGVTVDAQVEGWISTIIDVAVAVFNLLGIFKRKEDEEPVEGVVSAEAIAVTAEVIRATPESTHLDELEAILLESRNR